MDARILVVDDAKFARGLVVRALEHGGYTDVFQAASAEDAIRIFREREPDLVLLDITLPDRNDLSLLSDLLAIRPGARIVMNSAIGQELIIADALELGAKDFITKPFDEQDLLAVVASVLSEE